MFADKLTNTSFGESHYKNNQVLANTDIKLFATSVLKQLLYSRYKPESEYNI